MLDNDAEALGEVSRWIATALALPAFWSLREEWPDLHQEVLARLIESLRQRRYDTARDLRAYVQGIARYAAMQALNRRRRDVEANLSRAPGEARAEDAEMQVDRRRFARHVLDQASESCRQLIRSYFFEERSYAEIAESLQIPVGTVKSRLFRCLQAAALTMDVHAPRRNPARPRRNTLKMERAE